MLHERPIFLAPNLIQRPYRGGQRLARFRGADLGGEERMPEEWLASTTHVYGQPDKGPSILPDGRRLADAVKSDPVAYLGPDHVATFGADSALLVKLLDAQQRLSVHLHPSRSFVRKHLGTPYGKNEAWYILAAEPEACIHIGFREAIGARDLLDVVERGQGVRLLQQMNRISVAPGDSIYVPGGVPHAIGAGIFMIELQEPSDLLVRLEWSGYAIGSIPSDLGLGFATALQAVDRTVFDDSKLAGIIARADQSPVVDLLPVAAKSFFRLERAGNGSALTEGFRIIVVTVGRGEIRSPGWTVGIEAGQCLLLPHACGPASIDGAVEIACCRPGDPAVAREADPDLVKYH